MDHNKIIAIQMDPLDSINIETDSTFLIALEFQRKGYTLFFYEPKNLSIRERVVVSASGFFAKLSNHSDNYYQIIETIDQFELCQARLVLVRQDPPFDINYLTSTYILDLIKDKILVLNNPTGIRNCSEKLVPLLFPDITPITIVSSQIDELMAFAARHKSIVIKPLYDGGGRNVMKLDSNDPNLRKILSEYIAKFTYIMAQEFLEEIYGGDKRIILADGEPIGVYRRLAKAGDFRVNGALGGSFEASVISDDEVALCERIKSLLRDNGLFLVGIDVLGQYLMEINSTSPTGLPIINLLYQNNIEQKVVNLIERKMFSWYNRLN